MSKCLLTGNSQIRIAISQYIVYVIINFCYNHSMNSTNQLSLGSQQWNGYCTTLLAPEGSSHPADELDKNKSIVIIIAIQ